MVAVDVGDRLFEAGQKLRGDRLVRLLKLLFRNAEGGGVQLGRVELSLVVEHGVVAAGADVRKDGAHTDKLLLPFRKGALQKLRAICLVKNLHFTASRSFSMSGSSSSALVFKHTLLATSRAVMPV